MEKVKAPGLKWRQLAGGTSPVWIADEADVKRGYLPRTVNLKHLADQPEMLVAKCHALQADMLLWRTGYRADPLSFDGTVKSLLSIYQRHSESTFRSLKPKSVHPYQVYLGKLEGHIGERRIDSITGVDIKRWHAVWSDGGEHLAAATMARAVLDAALAFGVMLRLAGCADTVGILREARKKLPRPGSRRSVITADQVTAARAAAHADGRPSLALAYAITFETTLRLWDVIGQWWPLAVGGVSEVISTTGRNKWFGLRWEDIDRDLVLTYRPSKTERTTEAVIKYSLTKAPMVLEELQHWPVEKRTGPMIINENTGVPFHDTKVTKLWRRHRDAAGISATAWARDLRASGITEARAANASLDDAAKVAGHSSTKTTGKIYDRAILEAADRFAAARLSGRKSGNGPQ